MLKGLIIPLLSIAIGMLLLNACKVCPSEGVPYFCEQFDIEVVDSLDNAVPVGRLTKMMLQIDSVQAPISVVQNGLLTAFANQSRDTGCGTEPILTLQDSAGVKVAEMKVQISNYNVTHRDNTERKNCGCYAEITAMTPILNVEVMNIKCGENKIKVRWD